MEQLLVFCCALSLQRMMNPEQQLLWMAASHHASAQYDSWACQYIVILWSINMKAN